MALLTIPSGLAKGSPFTVTLDKSELFSLTAVMSSAHFSNQSNVSACLVKYQGDVEGAAIGHTRLMRFDLSQPNPIHTMSVSSSAADLFSISQILLIDQEGAVFSVPSSQIPSLNLDFSGGGGGGGGGDVSPTISFTSASYGGMSSEISWSASDATGKYVQLQKYDSMMGFWGQLSNLGSATNGSGTAYTAISDGNTLRLKLYDDSMYMMATSPEAVSSSWTVSTGGGGGAQPTVDNAVSTYGDWNDLSINLSAINKTAVNSITLYLSTWNGMSGTAEIGIYLNGVLQESVVTPSLSDTGSYQAVELQFVNSYDITLANIWELKFISRPYFTQVWVGSNYSPALTWYTSNRGTYPGAAYVTNGAPAEYTPGPSPSVQTAFDISIAESNMPINNFSMSGGTADYLLIGNNYGNTTFIKSFGGNTNDLVAISELYTNGYISYQSLSVSSGGGLSSPILLDDGFLYGDSMASARAGSRGLSSLNQIYGDWEGVNIDISSANQTVQTVRLYGDVSSSLSVSLTKNGVVQETVTATGSSTGIWNVREAFPIDVVFASSYAIDTNDVWKLEIGVADYYLATSSSSFALGTSNRGPQGSATVEFNPSADPFASVDQTGLPSISGVTMKRFAVGSGTGAGSGSNIGVSYSVAHRTDLSDSDKAAFVAGTALTNGNVSTKAGAVGNATLLGYMDGAQIGEVRMVKIAARSLPNNINLNSFYVYIKRNS